MSDRCLEETFKLWGGLVFFGFQDTQEGHTFYNPFFKRKKKFPIVDQQFLIWGL